MLLDIFNRFSNLYYRLVTQVYYRPQFKNIGSRTAIRRPILICNPEYISIGRCVSIRDGARLEVVCLDKDRKPLLSIGDYTNIEQNVHIVCHNKVSIGSNVSITGMCAIVDLTHPYEDVAGTDKVGDRMLNDDGYVNIGDNTVVGMGVVILPSVTIGRHVIIGANSVVTKDIPDYSVAAGSPAKVIKKYDFEQKQWVMVG